jgi:hypothetical protein
MSRRSGFAAISGVGRIEPSGADQIPRSLPRQDREPPERSARRAGACDTVSTVWQWRSVKHCSPRRRTAARSRHAAGQSACRRWLERVGGAEAVHLVDRVIRRPGPAAMGANRRVTPYIPLSNRTPGHRPVVIGCLRFRNRTRAFSELCTLQTGTIAP